MKWNSFIPVIGLFFVCMTCLCCQDDGGNVDDQEEVFLEYVAEQMDPYIADFGETKAGVVVGIYSENSFVSYEYGLDISEAATAHLRGASTTKSTTAAAILRLHQQGKINIDDFIVDKMPGLDSTYLPATPLFDIPFKSEITIKMLLQHRAGIFDVTNSAIPDSVDAVYAGERYTDYLQDEFGEDYTFVPEDILAPIAKHQLYYFEPNSSMHYSNSGYHLLGLIVERVSGMSLKAFKESEFIQPLGMTSSHFEIDGSQLTLDEPALPNFLMIGGTVLTDQENENLSLAYADGNIVTTVKDLCIWAYHLWGTNEVLNDHTLEMMTEMVATPDRHVRYGLGCSDYPDDLGVGHDGVRRSFMTTMRYHPESNKSYVVVFNSLNIDNLEYEDEIQKNLIRKAIELGL